MRDGIRFLTMIGLGLVVVVGCSGSGASPTAAGSQAPAVSSAPTNAPGGADATPEPSAADATEPPAGGGGSAAGVCALVTTDELAGIFGVPVTSEVIAGPPDTCDIQSNDAPLAAIVLTTTAPSYVFDAYASDPSATAVSGIGDKAAYSSEQQLLVILKGDTMLSIAVTDAARTPEERLELMKKVGALAAGRV
jgi:hypothetical protein